MKKITVVLVLIITLAFALRLYKIGANSLYGDELTIAYDTYSILKTGRDQTGEFLPLTFSMGAGRPGGYIYASLPFVAVFGPSVLGVRMLSVLSGIGVVILMYFLGKKLFNEKLGILAAFMTAISPWALSLSRGGFEAGFALFLSLLGVTSFLYANKKSWLYIITALSWGLAIHTYPTYKLTLPLLLLILIWYQGGLKKMITKTSKKFLYISLAVISVFAIVSIHQTFFGISEERFSTINIFVQENLRETITQKINYERSISELPKPTTVAFHNKPVEYLQALVESYLKIFSLEYLFLNGDGNPRHNASSMGMFYWVDLLFIGISIYYLIKNKKNHMLTFLLSWIFTSVIATALLITPHGLRSALMLPPVLILSSYGLYSLVSYTKTKFKWVVLVGLLGLWLIQFVLVLERVYFISPAKHSSFWAYPAKHATLIANENITNYKYVVISDRIESVEFAYPVYMQLDPNRVLEQRDYPNELGGYKFKKYDNVYIGSIPIGHAQEFVNSLDDSVIFIGNYLEERSRLDNYTNVTSLDMIDSLLIKKVEKQDVGE